MGGNAQSYEYFHINASDFTNEIRIVFTTGFKGHKAIVDKNDKDTKWEMFLGGGNGKQHQIRARPFSRYVNKKNPNRYFALRSC